VACLLEMGNATAALAEQYAVRVERSAALAKRESIDAEEMVMHRV
jgi:hypothetical protein